MMKAVANQLLNYSGHGGAKTDLSGQKKNCLKTLPNREKKDSIFLFSAAKLSKVS